MVVGEQTRLAIVFAPLLWLDAVLAIVGITRVVCYCKLLLLRLVHEGRSETRRTIYVVALRYYCQQACYCYDFSLRDSGTES